MSSGKRQITDVALETSRQHLSLNEGAVRCDALQFQDAWKTAQTAAGQARIAALERAFVLYEGCLLAGCEEEWSEALALYLDSTFVQIAEALIAWYRERGQLHHALYLSSQAAQRAPESGDFTNLARQLKHEAASTTPLALPASAPQPQMGRQVALQVLAAPKTPLHHAENACMEAHAALPFYANRFWGRDNERQILAQNLRVATPLGLRTLVGPPAIGKTRLAVEAAREAAQNCGWRVHFVSLAAQTNAAGFADAVRAGLGLPASAQLGPLQQVVAQLRAGQVAAQRDHEKCEGGAGVLLVLDNVEHLRPEIALEIQALRVQVPEVRLWATSRALLGLPGEEALPIEGLPVPRQNDDLSALSASPSVQLFVARARGARPAFAVSAANAGAIGDLCRHLEGWPLALELAATPSHSFTPAQILAQLCAHPDFLQRHTARREETGARHSSMENAIAWSFDLLSREAKATLLALGVFRGGAGRSEVETLARGLGGQARRTNVPLTELMTHSLVVCEEKGGVLRYELLEGVRQSSSPNQHSRSRARPRIGRKIGHSPVEAFRRQLLERQQLDEPTGAIAAEPRRPQLELHRFVAHCGHQSDSPSARWHLRIDRDRHR